MTLAALILGYALIAELPGVAKLTDARGHCPRYHYIAISPRYEVGCWTMGQTTWELRIIFPGRKPIVLNRLQTEMYLNFKDPK